MRKLVLLAALFSPLALAQTIIVAPHSLMRLPGNSSVLQVERLEVSDYGTLLIPAGIDDVKIGELVLGTKRASPSSPACKRSIWSC